MAVSTTGGEPPPALPAAARAIDGAVSGTSVVCGVDDSAAARAALRVARELAGLLGVRLVVVHAARERMVPRTPPIGVRYPSGLHEDLRDLALAQGERLLDDLVGAGGGIGERRVVVGPPAPVIVETAVEEDAALLVLGSRALGGVARIMAGSVSNDVVAAAPCPVVVVPAPEG